MISFDPLPFDEAIRFFEDKTVLTPDIYRTLVADARTKAFSVAGVARMDVLNDMYSAIDAAISNGTTFADFKGSLKETMARRGWQGMNPYRLDTIFRTNIQSAYQAGHYLSARWKWPRAFPTGSTWPSWTAGHGPGTPR